MKINTLFSRRKCLFLIKSHTRAFCLIATTCFNAKHGCINILPAENCVGNDTNGKSFCFLKKIYIPLKTLLSVTQNCPPSKNTDLYKIYIYIFLIFIYPRDKSTFSEGSVGL